MAKTKLQKEAESKLKTLKQEAEAALDKQEFRTMLVAKTTSNSNVYNQSPTIFIGNLADEFVVIGYKEFKNKKIRRVSTFRDPVIPTDKKTLKNWQNAFKLPPVGFVIRVNQYTTNDNSIKLTSLGDDGLLIGGALTRIPDHQYFFSDFDPITGEHNDLDNSYLTVDTREVINRKLKEIGFKPYFAGLAESTTRKRK